jgi:hypothetical protein
VSFLGDAKSSLGDAESSLGDAESSLGDAKSSLGDAKSSLGDGYPRPSAFRAVLPMANDTLLTAGSDCAIRFWDTARADRCEIICAPAAAGAPAPVQHYDVRSLRGVPVLQVGALPPSLSVAAPVQHYDVRSLRGVPVLQVGALPFSLPPSLSHPHRNPGLSPSPQPWSEQEVHQAAGAQGAYSPAAFAYNLRSPAAGVGAIAAASQLAAGSSLR